VSAAAHRGSAPARHTCEEVGPVDKPVIRSDVTRATNDSCAQALGHPNLRETWSPRYAPCTARPLCDDRRPRTTTWPSPWRRKTGLCARSGACRSPVSVDFHCELSASDRRPVVIGAVPAIPEAGICTHHVDSCRIADSLGDQCAPCSATRVHRRRPHEPRRPRRESSPHHGAASTCPYPARHTDAAALRLACAIALRVARRWPARGARSGRSHASRSASAECLNARLSIRTISAIDRLRPASSGNGEPFTRCPAWATWGGARGGVPTFRSSKTPGRLPAAQRTEIPPNRRTNPELVAGSAAFCATGPGSSWRDVRLTFHAKRVAPL